MEKKEVSQSGVEAKPRNQGWYGSTAVHQRI